MFFRQRWQDDRLRHSLTDNLTLIVGSRQPSDIIWVPDTVFIDSVASEMHHVTVNNHKLDINYDGSVFWGTRVTVSPSCPLNLRAYPMDRQECVFELVSYAYASRHVVYKWKDQGLKISPKMPQMAQFILENCKTSRQEISYVAGNYTVLVGHFHFKRLVGFAVIQIYIPTICVVIVSWLSLWVRRTAVPARIALLITTLLTISTVWAAVNAQLPRVNYVKSIDVFMMASFGCVIMTLLEFTVVINTDILLKFFQKASNGNPDALSMVESGEKLLKGKEMVKQEKLIQRNNAISTSGAMFDNQKYEKRNACIAQTKPTLNINPFRGVGLRYRSKVNYCTKIERDASVPTKKIDGETRSQKLANSIEWHAKILFPLVYTCFLVCYFVVFVTDTK